MPRHCQLLFIVWFLGLIFLVAATQAGLEISRGRRPQFLEIFTQPPTRENLRAYERAMESSSIYARTARAWMQYFWFVLLRNPGDKALVGSDGSLFYKPDFRYLVEPSNTEKAVRAIIGFRDQLVRYGIHLLVVPVPGKPSVHSDKLTRRAATFRSPTQLLITILQRAGVEALDLLPMLNGSRTSYLAYDTHWSCAASQSAAQAVGRRLHDLGWVADGAADYELRPVIVRRRGDIVRMINVPGLELRFPPEEIVCGQVVSDGALYKDDPHSPILILGDSFLRIYQTDQPGAAGFIAYLARELKRPVTSIVNDGGASTLVRQELSRHPELLRDKKVVIWEFAERDIRFGAEDWRDVPL